MKLEITQNEYARFNIFGGEKSTSFSLVIVGDNGYTIKKETPDGKEIRARLYCCSDEDSVEEFNNLVENGKIDEIYSICFEYIDSIRSTQDYRSDLEYFYEIYSKNKKEIEKNTKKELIDRLEEKLKELKKLNFNGLEEVKEEIKQKEIAETKRKIEMRKNQFEKYKETADEYTETLEKIKELEGTLSKLTNK